MGLAPSAVLEVAEAGRATPETGTLVAATRLTRATVAVATGVRVVATGVNTVATAVALRRRACAPSPCPATSPSLVTTTSLSREPTDVVVRRAMEDVGRPAKETDVASPSVPLQGPIPVVPTMEGQEAFAIPATGLTLAAETVRITTAA